MAILLELKSKPFTLQKDELFVREETCMIAIEQYLHGYFEPTSIEIWDDAPIAELGGKIIHKEDINVGSVSEIRNIIDRNIKNLGIQKQLNTIIRIYGNWKLNNTERKGFFSINHNPRWQEAYGDVDIDIIFGDDEITKLMWNDNDRNILVNDFFTNFLNDFRNHELDKQMILAWICFASNIPSGKEITQIKAAYYHDIKQFIKDALETYKQKNERVQKSLYLQYIVEEVNAYKHFHDKMREKLENFKISKIDGNSIILIGEELDSFNKLYENLSKEYFIKIFDNLQRDSDVDNVVKRAIRGESDLSEYL